MKRLASGSARRLRVLMVGSYPVDPPRHGGQIRVKAIKDAYEAAGADVTYVCLSPPGVYGPGSLALGQEGRALLASVHPGLSDAACGRALADDPVAQGAFLAIVKAVQPDVVQWEQLHAFLGLRRLLGHLPADALLVYSSQNVEAPLKRDSLSEAALGPRDRELLAELEEAERHAVQVADLVIACSTADAATYRAWGPRRLVLARNASAPSSPALLHRLAWRLRSRALPKGPYALYVASAHPPNADGFLDVFASGSGLHPGQGLVVAGTVKYLLDGRIRGDAGITLAGPQSTGRLQAMIKGSSAIVLPIRSGGGSNLKTAEALVSGKRVVTTTQGLRSFEEFADEEGVVVEDDAAAFRAAVADALAMPPLRLSAAQRARRAEATWAVSLRPLVDWLGGVRSARRRPRRQS